MEKMFLLFEREYQDETFEIVPIIAAKTKEALEDYLDTLLKESKDYDATIDKHAEECKNIIRNYLYDNLDAITGWRDVRSAVPSSFHITDREKENIIDFLCNNYAFHYGKNIIEVPYDGSFVARYCDVFKLKKPYPKLPNRPEQPNNYKIRSMFQIREIEVIEEKPIVKERPWLREVLDDAVNSSNKRKLWWER